MGVGRDTLGISLELVSTFLSACGYTFQKMAHMDVDAGRTTKPYFKHWKFIVGLVLLVLGAVLTVAIFGLLDQSKQAPMGACTLVYNSILSYKFLGEHFGYVDFVSSALMATGTIVAVLFSSKHSTKFTFDEILDRLNDDLVYGYSVFIFIAIGTAVAVVEYTSRVPREAWSKRQSRIVAFCCSFLGGVLSGFTSYFAKSFITIFYDGDWSAFKKPYVYIYIACLVTSLFNQLRYLNRGLRFFDSLQIVPVYQSFIVFSGMISGIVYFGDMRDPEPVSAGKFAGFGLGGAVTISGILLLLWKRKSRPAAPRAGDPGDFDPEADDMAGDIGREVSLHEVKAKLIDGPEVVAMSPASARSTDPLQSTPFDDPDTRPSYSPAHGRRTSTTKTLLSDSHDDHVVDQPFI